MSQQMGLRWAFREESGLVWAQGAVGGDLFQGRWRGDNQTVPGEGITNYQRTSTVDSIPGICLVKSLLSKETI